MLGQLAGTPPIVRTGGPASARPLVYRRVSVCVRDCGVCSTILSVLAVRSLGRWPVEMLASLVAGPCVLGGRTAHAGGCRDSCLAAAVHP